MGGLIFDDGEIEFDIGFVHEFRGGPLDGKKMVFRLFEQAPETIQMTFEDGTRCTYVLAPVDFDDLDNNDFYIHEP